MAGFDLNLSTQPFRGYRLINVALLVLLAVFLVLSAWQASGFVRYSGMARSIRAEEQRNRVDAEALRQRMAELESKLDTPESTAKLTEIEFLNHLISRKSLSWAKLFGVLEGLVPENVHLTSLTPDISPKGGVTLRFGVAARSITDVTEFVERLEKSPLFANMHVTVEEKKESTGSKDVDVTLSTVYYP